jgi:hypothetical protein
MVRTESQLMFLHDPAQVGLPNSACAHQLPHWHVLTNKVADTVRQTILGSLKVDMMNDLMRS